jgi:hypothetical protein
MERDQKKLALKDVLLPTNVRPSHYFVQITPHFESFSFDGFETIEIEGTPPPPPLPCSDLQRLQQSCAAATVVRINHRSFVRSLGSIGGGAVVSATNKVVVHSKEIEVKAVDFIHHDARLTATGACFS